MKITIPAGIIECTVDEYEDLVARGLVPGKEQLIEQNSDDDWLKSLSRLDEPGRRPDWMKNVVALYGCEIPQPITAQSLSSVDQTQFTANITVNNTADNKTRLAQENSW